MRATVSVGLYVSQPSWNLSAVSQPSKVEQHSDHSASLVRPAQLLSFRPHADVSNRDRGKPPPRAGLGGGGAGGASLHQLWMSLLSQPACRSSCWLRPAHIVQSNAAPRSAPQAP